MDDSDNFLMPSISHLQNTFSVFEIGTTDPDFDSLHTKNDLSVKGVSGFNKMAQQKVVVVKKVVYMIF